jgi:hypothetical protein
VAKSSHLAAVFSMRLYTFPAPGFLNRATSRATSLARLSRPLLGLHGWVYVSFACRLPLPVLVAYHKPAICTIRSHHNGIQHAVAGALSAEASTYFEAFLGVVAGLSAAGLGVRHVFLALCLLFHLLLVTRLGVQDHTGTG